MSIKKHGVREKTIEFVGTRNQANALFFEQMALASGDDLNSRRYFKSLADFFRNNLKDTGRRFRATISKIN